MGRVRSRLCLLGGSLGLLCHALLDVVHGDGDGLRRGKGEQASMCVRSSGLGPSQVVGEIRVQMYSNGRRTDRRTRVIGCQRRSKRVSWQTINK